MREEIQAITDPSEIGNVLALLTSRMSGMSEEDLDQAYAGFLANEGDLDVLREMVDVLEEPQDRLLDVYLKWAAAFEYQRDRGVLVNRYDQSCIDVERGGLYVVRLHDEQKTFTRRVDAVTYLWNEWSSEGMMHMAEEDLR